MKHHLEHNHTFKRSTKIKNKYTVIIFSGILAFSSLFAGEVTWVKYGWQAFRNTGDAASLSLGGALSAYSNSSASVLHNPAHITNTYPRSLVYAHQNRFNGVVGDDLLSMRFKTKSDRQFGLSVIHESVSNIIDTRSSLLDWGLDGVPNTGDSGEGNGILDEGERLDADRLKQFSQHQWAFHLASGWSIRDYQIGIAAKGLIHLLGEHTGSGLGFDLGLTKSFNEQLKAGLSVYDVLTSWVLWDNGTKEITSPTIALGGSYSTPVLSLPVKTAIIADILLHTEGRAVSDYFSVRNVGGNFRIGTEVIINGNTILRLGRNEKDIFSAGLGVRWDVVDINYGYQVGTLDAELGSSHILSFAVNPDWVMNIVLGN